MNSLTPLADLMQAADHDGAKAYVELLWKIVDEHQWRDFNGMVGRINLMRLAIHREICMPARPFSIGVADPKTREQILFSYRAEVKKALGICRADQKENVINSCGKLLLTISDLMTSAVPANFRATARTEIIQAQFKNRVFPREIGERAIDLADYRHLLLELDLGL
jgi:hypothetical protein